MNDKDEIIIKEYPNSTRWVDGRDTIGTGNLILTSKRLTFLNRVELSDKQIERIHELSAKATTSRLIDYALTLHKMNFQIPLSSVTRVRIGLYSLLPLPRPCLRISYMSEKKRTISTASFMFTIPLLKGFFKFEITVVQGWIWMIKKVLRHKQLIA